MRYDDVIRYAIDADADIRARHAIDYWHAMLLHSGVMRYVAMLMP